VHINTINLRALVLLFVSQFYILTAFGLAEVHASPSVNVPTPAVKSSAASLASMLEVARAGRRIVAVGNYGIILLSDDEGMHVRQASSVPISSTLTSVFFLDQQKGWAVGHWGTILRTIDGGENWTIQRQDVAEDRPLFSVHFFNENEGVAVGLWSLVLKTSDGGITWSAISLPKPPDGSKADRNLYKVFGGGDSLYIAAEKGMILTSDDKGINWRYLDTGYGGSFWAGIVLADGSILIGGLRGTIYRSTDKGKHWTAITTDNKSSITDFVEADGVIFASAKDGVLLESVDGGTKFIWKQRNDRLPINSIIPVERGVLLLTKKGIYLEQKWSQ
jgi:photosystem II stability/assembly factor-like uncharacterized protein